MSIIKMGKASNKLTIKAITPLSQTAKCYHKCLARRQIATPTIIATTQSWINRRRCCSFCNSSKISSIKACCRTYLPTTQANKPQTSKTTFNRRYKVTASSCSWTPISIIRTTLVTLRKWQLPNSFRWFNSNSCLASNSSNNRCRCSINRWGCNNSDFKELNYQTMSICKTCRLICNSNNFLRPDLQTNRQTRQNRWVTSNNRL